MTVTPIRIIAFFALTPREGRLLCRPMPIIYLVRHGRADTADPNPRDPGLDLEGHAQACAVARDLTARISIPAAILSSPLRRCRSTAVPLAESWARESQLEPRVIEVPSPQPAGRGREKWLKKAFGATWTELGKAEYLDHPGFGKQLADWRSNIVEAIRECRTDTVVFTHFVPINVLVGRALGEDRVVCFRPDNCSVTAIEVSGKSLRLLSLGREATNRVL
ncbi:MAG TPA: histidine phosphatase family protein [Steroidobacteraceae bacterium]|jgi:broad specificity phosphatase PhoE